MSPPQRIVSLLPSSTEICFALGLGDRVVGVSHECDFPEEVAGRPVLTSPKVDPHATSAEIDRQVRALVADGLSVYRIDEERLRELQPDLIITQDVCEVCAVSLAEVREATARLLGKGADILSLSPLSLADVLDDIVRVGRAAAVEDAAHRLVTDLRARLDRLRAETAALPRPRVLFLEWLSPPMVAGHWTPEPLRAAGGEPMLAKGAKALERGEADAWIVYALREAVTVEIDGELTTILANETLIAQGATELTITAAREGAAAIVVSIGPPGRSAFDVL
jgi:iron complex transport system substrate-binding protein